MKTFGLRVPCLGLQMSFRSFKYMKFLIYLKRACNLFLDPEKFGFESKSIYIESGQLDIVVIAIRCQINLKEKVSVNPLNLVVAPSIP